MASQAQQIAQKIGINPTIIAPSAALEVENTSKGVLLPRVALTSTTDVTTIPSPATSLLVYNTATAGTVPFNVEPGYYFYTGTEWSKILFSNNKFSADPTVGSVVAFASSTLPPDYLECNGAAVSRTTYAALFARIGTTYGAGNGTTTFNLPDLRGEFIRGWDNGRGADASRTLGSWQKGTLNVADDGNAVMD